MDRRWLLVFIYLTYLLHEAWTLLPANFELYRPFPFSDQEITIPYYIFQACEYAIWIVLMVVIYELSGDIRDVIKWFLIFQICEFIEYFLTYNEAQFFLPNPINKVGINITNIKIVTMFFLVTKKLFQWKSGK